jgi:uncharacterized protein (TIGR02246 family)
MTREKDEAAILALERAYDAAWNAGDVRALIGLFTADAVVVNPRGEIARGRVELERVLGRFLLGPA